MKKQVIQHKENNCFSTAFIFAERMKLYELSNIFVEDTRK